MNKRPWYAINLAEDGRSATIAVRGKIGDWWEGKSIEQIDYDLANIGAVDEIVNLLAEYRATPIVYIGSDAYASTIVYGFYKDFTVVIAYYLKSICNLEIEGLT